MAVDNTLRYRGFNSYELAPSETLYSSLSDCEYLGFVTTQWVALKVGGTIADGEVRIVWIDDTGGQLGATERHTFTPTRLWQRHTWTVAVPPEAVKLRIQFEGGTQGYNFACPMTEPGEIASSFDPSIASAVAYMTSEGAYVGFLNADQIIAGVLRAIAGDSGFDLEAPRIWMTSKDGSVTWEATPDNPILVKQGDTPIFKVQGGSLTMTGEVNAASGTIGGYEITATGLRKSLFKTFGPFTEADETYVYDRILGTYPTTQADLDKYDFFNYGFFETQHVMEIYRMRTGVKPNPQTVEYIVELNTAKPSELIKLYSPTYPDRLPTTLGNATVKAFKLAQHGAPSGTFGTLDTLTGKDKIITVENGIITSISN